jgi:hypothetical protein
MAGLGIPRRGRAPSRTTRPSFYSRSVCMSVSWDWVPIHSAPPPPRPIGARTVRRSIDRRGAGHLGGTCE